MDLSAEYLGLTLRNPLVASASRRTCSSKSEYITIAPTPAAANSRTPSTVRDSGDADATSGLRSARPM